jgi:hypothetical protein
MLWARAGDGTFMFLILWEFEVKPGEERAFEKVYGPEGPWVELFQGDPHYRQTLLLKDPSRSRIISRSISGHPKTTTRTLEKPTMMRTRRWIKLPRI